MSVANSYLCLRLHNQLVPTKSGQTNLIATRAPQSIITTVITLLLAVRCLKSASFILMPFLFHENQGSHFSGIQLHHWFMEISHEIAFQRCWCSPHQHIWVFWALLRVEVTDVWAAFSLSTCWSLSSMIPWNFISHESLLSPSFKPTTDTTIRATCGGWSWHTDS